MTGTVINVSKAFTDDGFIEMHDRNQQHGIGYAVCNVIFTAERIAERMNGSRTGSGDSETAIESGDLHIVLGSHGIRVFAGIHDVVQNQICSLQSKRIR